MWCYPDGSALAPRLLARELERTRRRAGLRPIGWHVLRHTFASHLAMRGVPILTIKELCGHATITMTVRVGAGRQAPLVDRLDEAGADGRFREAGRGVVR